LEREPGDSCDLEDRASFIRERRHAKEHSVADRVGNRHFAALRKLHTPLALTEVAARRERRPELLDEERNALRPLVELRGQTRRRISPENLGGKQARLLGAQRPERELSEAACP